MNVDYLLLIPLHWYILWAFLTPVLLTVIPPRPYRKYVSGFILFSILVYTQFIYTIDPTSKNASVALTIQGVFFNLFFYTFNLFFLVEYPELTDYRPDVETLEYVRSLKPCTLAKLKWCIQRSVLVTLQGHGWNWQIGMKDINHQKVLVKKPKTKTNMLTWLKEFFVDKILIRYTIYDTIYHLYISTEYIKSKGWGYGHTKDLVLLATESQLNFMQQLILSLGSAYVVYFGIETIYNITTFINVFLLNLYDISEYPNLFGTFNNEYTIKSLWKNLWHKLMYQLSVPQSKYLSGCDYKAKHLNIKPRFGTELWRTYLMYFLVFAFTGTFHAAAILNMPWSRGKGYNVNAPSFVIHYLPQWCSRCFYSFLFFPAQFFLIAFETIIQELYLRYAARKIRLPSTVTTIIGLVWIGFAEAYLLQMYVDEMVKSGFDIEELVVPFTPVHYVFEKFNLKL